MPRNKHPEKTVNLILDAAVEIFLTKGYDQTTVLDIVENMGGLTRGAFYHHFKSKEEVMNAVADKFFAQNNPFEHVEELTHLNGLEKIKELFRFTIESQFREDRKKIANAVLDLLKNPHFLMEQVKTIQEVTPYLASLIEEGIADGSIRQANANILAEFILHQVNLWLIPTVYPGDARDTYEKIMLLKTVFEGIGCPIIDEHLLKVFVENVHF